MKKKKIANVLIHGGSADVFITGSTGGEFMLYAEPNSQITIGIDDPDWWRVVECALHELIEIICVGKGIRYRESCLATDSADNYLFCMNHPEFSDTISKAAYAFEQIRKPLKRAWCKKHGKKEPKMKKSRRKLAEKVMAVPIADVQQTSMDLIKQVSHAVPKGGNERNVICFISRAMWMLWCRAQGDPLDTLPTDWNGTGKTNRVYGAQTQITDEEGFVAFCTSEEGVEYLDV